MTETGSRAVGGESRAGDLELHAIDSRSRATARGISEAKSTYSTCPVTSGRSAGNAGQPPGTSMRPCLDRRTAGKTLFARPNPLGDRTGPGTGCTTTASHRAELSEDRTTVPFDRTRIEARGLGMASDRERTGSGWPRVATGGREVSLGPWNRPSGNRPTAAGEESPWRRSVKGVFLTPTDLLTAMAVAADRTMAAAGEEDPAASAACPEADPAEACPAGAEAAASHLAALRASVSSS